jgi:hypothetical protein
MQHKHILRIPCLGCGAEVEGSCFQGLPVDDQELVMHNAVAVVEPYRHALVGQESRCGISGRRVASICNYAHVDASFLCIKQSEDNRLRCKRIRCHPYAVFRRFNGFDYQVVAPPEGENATSMNGASAAAGNSRKVDSAASARIFRITSTYRLSLGFLYLLDCMMVGSICSIFRLGICLSLKPF